MTSPHKHPVTFGIIAALIVLHIVLCIALFSSGSNDGEPTPPKTESGDGGEKPSTVVEQGGTDNVPAGNDSKDELPQPPKPPIASPKPPVASAVYYDGYYRPQLRTLSKSVQRQVAQCRSGLVLDMDTNTILWSKEADKIYPIASITKLMTSIMLVERADSDPAVSLGGTTVKVTASDFKITKRVRGVYLNQGEEYTLDEYLKCMLISSANDCAYMTAKFLAGGDADAFPAMMNAKAKAMGLKNMTFHNPHGLPIDGKNGRTENQATAYEVAFLAQQATKYPAIMKWAGTKRDCIRENANRFDLNSTNRLLRDRVPGVNGLKTGYTDTAGHCIVVTCKRDGRNIMVVVMGVRLNDYGRTRNAIAKALLDWAYAQK